MPDNNPAVETPKEQPPIGTVETPPKAEETPKEQPQKVVIGGREFSSYEEAAHKLEESRVEAERKMHESTQRAKELERRSTPPPQVKTPEQEAAELAELSYSDPVEYNRRILSKVNEATQAGQFAAISVQRPGMQKACKAAHKDYDKYADDIDQMVNSGVAFTLMKTYPHLARVGNEYEVAYQNFSMADHLEAKRVAEAREANEKGTGTPASSAGKVQPMELDENDETLSAKEKTIAHNMFSELTPVDAEKKYLEGRKSAILRAKNAR